MFSDVASKQSLKKTSLKKHRKTPEFEDLGNFDADIQVKKLVRFHNGQNKHMLMAV